MIESICRRDLSFEKGDLLVAIRIKTLKESNFGKRLKVP
jgi:hypothetical protein